jgi:hypothetical protein
MVVSIMPTDIRVVLARDFIRATADGELDFESSKKALTEVASAASHLVTYEILLDTRKTQARTSVADLWYLAAELSSLGTTFCRRTAVLCPIEHFDNAAFFETCAQNRGFRVKAFASFEEAMDWLQEAGA